VYNKSLLRARWQHFNIEPDKRRLGEDPLGAKESIALVQG
jgi:hypothetical protein